MSDKVYQKALEMYGDDELAKAILEHADAQVTVQKIESGELVLPHPADARKWLDKKLGRDNQTPSEREAHKRISELEKQLHEMQGKDKPHASQSAAVQHAGQQGKTDPKTPRGPT